MRRTELILISHPWVFDRDGVYRIPAFQQFEWLDHGFGTRLSADWPNQSHLATLKQTHSAKVVLASNGAGQLGEGDALISAKPGLLVGVRTADCVPILLLDPRSRAVAAIHAGWRGTSKEIALSTITQLKGDFGTVADDVYATIGPSIGHCCYEVGPDVARQFARWWPRLEKAAGRIRLDLMETNRRQLVEAGVRPERIFADAPCTLCTPLTLHSYRRDGELAGRMVSAIGIR